MNGMTLELKALVIESPVATAMYGLDVLTKLRELDADARVVVASADIQTSTRAMVEEAGARGFINKPFATENVLGAVESAMGGE